MSAVTPIRDLPRLLASAEPDVTPQQLSWALAGRRQTPTSGEPRDWLRLTGTLLIALRCVRCMSPVQLSIAFDRDYVLVADEAAAEQVDAQTDDYDALVASRRFDLSALLEDEALLTLPVAPSHADCPLPTQPIEPRANPFASLRQLRKEPPGDKC